ncbi:MAG: hypothetical protein F4X94_08565 [Dehalococcoidia bacterium]|nr:hypothetical protein [Dehalococcoidia bacterium]
MDYQRPIYPESTLTITPAHSCPLPAPTQLAFGGFGLDSRRYAYIWADGMYLGAVLDRENTPLPGRVRIKSVDYRSAN